MYNTIDDYVVVLKFDNAQFESATQDSMKSLEKLKSSLKFDESEKGFKKITASAKAVNLGGLSKGIDAIASRFSALGVAGMTVIQNLTNSAIGVAKKIITAIPTQIIQGGWKRALNIEQAKFQIEGLGKSWKDLYQDMDYAVSGTAYGIDAAAKAASMLSASGVEAGESMKAALRGISGVAAMSSSDYESISNIFTTVAGQGKLMTMQLRQLEARGLNVAATLGEQLGHSEAEIREMVTAGVIDFQTFASAMDNAFGEHAKAANDTFTGALSNVKAALSRIGADVAEVELFNFRNILNSIRPVIDNVRYAIQPLLIAFNKLSIATSGKIIDGFNKIGKALEPLSAKGKALKNTWTEEFEKIKEGVSSTSKSVTKNVTDTEKATANAASGISGALSETGKILRVTKEEAQAAWDIWNKGTYGNQPERKKNIEALGMSYEHVRVYLNELIDKNFDLSKVEIQVGDAAEEAGEKATNAAKTATSAVVSGINRGASSGSRLVTLLSLVFNTVKNAGSAIKSTFKIAGTVITSVLKGIAPHVTDIATTVFGKLSQFSAKAADVMERVADKVYALRGKITLYTSKTIAVLRKPFQYIESAAKTVFNYMKPGLVQIGNALGNAITQVANFVKEHELLRKAGEGVAKILSILWNLITKLADGVKTFFKQLSESEGFQNLKEELKVLWDRFKDFSADKIDLLKTSLKNLFDTISGVDLSAPTKFVNILSNLANNIANFIKKINNGEKPIKEFFASFSERKGPLKFLAKLPSAFGTGSGAIKTFVSNIKSFNFKDAIGSIKEGLSSLKDKSGGKLDDLKNFFSKLEATLTSVKWDTIYETATGILKLYALFSAVVKLRKMADAATGTIKSIGGFFKSWSNPILNNKPKKTFADNFRTMAIAIGIIAGSLFLISKIDSKGLTRSVETLVGVVAGLTILIKAMGEVPAANAASIQQLGNTMLKMSISMLLIAVAIRQLNKFKLNEVIYGGTIITAFTMMFVGASRLMGAGAAGSGAAFVAMAAAILILIPAIKMFAMMKWETIAKGGGVVVGLMMSLAIAGRIAGGKKGLAAAAAIMSMAIAIGILVPCIQILAQMKSEKLAKGVAAIVGCITGIAAATRIAKRSIADKDDVWKGLSAIILSVTASLTILSFIPTQKLLKAAVALNATIISISVMLQNLHVSNQAIQQGVMLGIIIGSITASLFILSRLDTKTTLANAVVLSGILIALGGSLRLMSTMPFESALAGALTMGAILAEVVTALYMLDELNPSSTLKNAVSLSAIIVAVGVTVRLLSGVGWAGGLSALAAFSIFLGGIIGLSIVLGKLSEKFPGMAKAMEEGKKIAQLAGEFIGAFLGGALSTVMDAVSYSLPVLADNLSTFAEKVQPFIDGMRGIGNDVVTGAANLSKAILALTGADFVSNVGGLFSSTFGGLQSLISGDGFKAGTQTNPFDQMKTQLTALGTAITEFSKSVSNISEGDINKISLVGKAVKPLATIASNLQGTGGLWQKVAGEKDLANFGDKVKAFVKSFVTAANAAKGISLAGITQISMISVAAKPYVALANDLPRSGASFLKGLMGEKDLADFGDKVKAFVKSFVTAANAAKGISLAGITQISMISVAAKPYVALANDLPRSGRSLFTGIAGKKDLADFGEKVASLVESISGVSKKASNIDRNAAQNLTNVSQAIKSFISISSQLSNTGGVKGFFTGNKDLGNFGSTIQTFVTQYAKAATSAAGISEDKVASVNRALSAVKTANATISSIGSSGGGSGVLLTIASGLTGVSLKVKAYATNMTGINTSKITANANAVKNSITNIGNAAKNASGIGGSFTTAGSTAISSFVRGFNSQKGNATNAATNMITQVVSRLSTYSNRFYQVATQYLTRFIQGITSKTSSIQAAGVNLSNRFVQGVNSRTSTAYNSGSSLAQSAYRGANNNGVYSKFYTLGGYAASGFRDGINNKAYSAALAASRMVTNAINAAKRAQRSHSPSKVFRELGGYAGEGYSLGFEDTAKDVQNSVVNTLLLAIQAAKETAENDEITPMITPLVDLSNVEAGLGDVATLFGNSSQTLSGLRGFSNTISSLQNQNQTYNDSNVITAINNLRSEMDSLHDSILNGDIYVRLNDGTLVGVIAKGVDKEIAKRLNLAQRGN